jgi:hypothetical protein
MPRNKEGGLTIDAKTQEMDAAVMQRRTVPAPSGSWWWFLVLKRRRRHSTGAQK